MFATGWSPITMRWFGIRIYLQILHGWRTLNAKGSPASRPVDLKRQWISWSATHTALHTPPQVHRLPNCLYAVDHRTQIGSKPHVDHPCPALKARRAWRRDLLSHLLALPTSPFPADRTIGAMTYECKWGLWRMRSLRLRWLTSATQGTLNLSLLGWNVSFK